MGDFGQELHVDVCFNNMLGVYNTRMLSAYASCAWYGSLLQRTATTPLTLGIARSRYVRPLVLAIKHWAKRRGNHPHHHPQFIGSILIH